MSWSLSWVVQFQPTAPGMCPWSYAAVSTSTSTSRTLASPRLSATQSVVTIDSGCAGCSAIVGVPPRQVLISKIDGLSCERCPATELNVVDQLRDRGIVAAQWTLGVAPQLDGPEVHLEGVYQK